jgi:Ca2+/Na+ antiporter
MSSYGTSLVCQNNNTNNNEGVVPQGGNYSLQSEVYDPKTAARSKFQQGRRSKRQEKVKNLRRDGKDVPKHLPKPRNGLISPSSQYEKHSMVEYYPQCLVSYATSTFSQFKPDKPISALLQILEVLGALSISLPKCGSSSEVAAQLVLGIRALTNGSITENLLKSASTVDWLKKLFGYNVFEPQSGLGDAESWLNLLPKMKDNWEAVRNAPVFEKVSNVITLAASLGLCSVTNLKWSVGGVDVFRVGTLQKHASAADFCSAVMDTIIAFIEGGYECFRQRSFRPLLFSTEESKLLDELYFPLMELHEHAMVFNLHSKPIAIRGETRPITDLEYGSLLNEAIDLAERAYKSSRGTWQQTVLDKRLTVLRQNRAAYEAKRIDGSMRYAPFSIYVYGESGVGKSTVASVLMADCLRAAGANPDPKHTAIIKESDKFDSALKGDTEGIFLDDMGNTKADFLEKSPTERLIDINNNMITYANKADLHEKGKIEVRPKVLLITSNATLNQHARLGSIHPFSIVRRADVHVEVKVKQEFATEDGRLDSRKVMRKFSTESLVSDIWDLYIRIPHEPGTDCLKPYKAGGDKPVGINELLRYCTSECKLHFDIQRQIVAKGEGLVASRNYCPKCNLAQDLCECTEDFEKQAMCDLSFEYIRDQFDFMSGWRMYLASCVPSFAMALRSVQWLYMYYHLSDLRVYESKIRRDLGIMFFLSLFLSLSMHVESCTMVIVLLVAHLFCYVVMLAKWKDNMCARLANRRDITRELFTSLRKSKAVQFFSVCFVGKIIYNMISSYRTVQMLSQSALAPSNVDEIAKRDAEINPWANPLVEELHVEDRCATMTHDQIVKKISKNLFHGQFVENGFIQTCDILALGGTLYLMPLHLFENRKDMKALITKSNPENLNSTFKGYVSVSHMVPITGKDLAIVNIPSGGVHSDITHLFPGVVSVTGTGELLYRNADGELKRDLMRITPTRDSEAGGPGFQYKAPYNTFTGMCMATVVGKFQKSCIAGFHLRGITGTPSGKALTVCQSEIAAAMIKARTAWKGAFPSHVNGTFPTTRYDKQVIVSRDVHRNSPINYLPVGSNVEYLGQNNQRASHTKSNVVTTPISEVVEEVTGVPNKHGPPAFHRWKMWQASLEYSANPGAGVEPSLIDRAVMDYVEGIIETFERPEFADMVKKELKPLSEMETLCGRDGARFIDAMCKSTSKGFPLSGPKSDMITLLDPEDYPEHACPAKCDELITQECEKMCSELLAGRRCYSIFKACVKDEPTKIGKDKVRVFQAADWATQLMVRKYYLPIARLLSLFPLVSECAVGVNAQGPEWDQLARHMKKFGENRILAGDYSKYDLRMPAGMIIAAFKCLLDIAERCGEYSSDDLTIMRGIATEIAFSCVAYNGDIIIHRGSNPSGQNLTVYINCIVNSLLLRSAYYKMYPADFGNPEPFRTNVAVMTYGDDVKGSVRRGHDWFNHISYAHFLKERDMVFTMPDKESEPTPYMSDTDADFLKRHNVYNEETGLIHGVLDEASIFKSLHTVLRSKAVSLEDQSAMNIDGALREWWQYGREMYEMRRLQMIEVAQRTGVSHMCTELGVSYDMRMNLFREKYLNNEE